MFFMGLANTTNQELAMVDAQNEMRSNEIFIITWICLLAILVLHCGEETTDCEYECKESGKRVLLNGKCVATSDIGCSESDGCSYWGECSLVDGHCDRNSDEDCAKSIGCRGLGQCSYLPDNMCYAKNDEDCKKGVMCRRQKVCKAENGRCVWN